MLAELRIAKGRWFAREPKLLASIADELISDGPAL
jgi:hypothetical protein